MSCWRTSGPATTPTSTFTELTRWTSTASWPSWTPTATGRCGYPGPPAADLWCGCSPYRHGQRTARCIHRPAAFVPQQRTHQHRTRLLRRPRQTRWRRFHDQAAAPMTGLANRVVRSEPAQGPLQLHRLARKKDRDRMQPVRHPQPDHGSRHPRRRLDQARRPRLLQRVEQAARVNPDAADNSLLSGTCLSRPSPQPASEHSSTKLRAQTTSFSRSYARNSTHAAAAAISRLFIRALLALVLASSRPAIGSRPRRIITDRSSNSARLPGVRKPRWLTPLPRW